MPVAFCKAGSPDCECNRAEEGPTNLPRANMGGYNIKANFLSRIEVESPRANRIHWECLLNVY